MYNTKSLGMYFLYMCLHRRDEYTELLISLKKVKTLVGTGRTHQNHCKQTEVTRVGLSRCEEELIIN